MWIPVCRMDVLAAAESTSSIHRVLGGPFCDLRRCYRSRRSPPRPKGTFEPGDDYNSNKLRRAQSWCQYPLAATNCLNRINRGTCFHREPRDCVNVGG